MSVKLLPGCQLSSQKKKIIFLYIKPVLWEVCSNYANTDASFSGLWKKALTCGYDVGAERETAGSERLPSEHLKTGLVRRGRCADRRDKFPINIYPRVLQTFENKSW